MRALVRSGLTLAVGGMALLTVSTPAWSGGSGGSPEGAPYGEASAARTCDRIIRERPLGMVNHEIVPAGPLAPGQDVVVTVTWNPGDWSGESLHQALNCVTVNGRLAMNLSAEERPTLNDGVFERKLTIPDDVGKECQICSEGYVAGDGPGGAPQEGSSNPVCFRVGPPPEPKPAPVPAPEPKPAPAPEPAPLPTQSAPTPAPDDGSRRAEASGGDSVSGAQTVPAPEPVRQVAAPELPRTGSAANRPLQVAGGLGLALGGMATVVGVQRRPRQR